MNTRLDYLWEKVSLFTQFSDLAKIFEPIFFKISLKTGPIFDHPLLVKIGSEIRKSVPNRKTDIFSSPGLYAKIGLKSLQEYSADNINRQHFQMQVFLAF